VWPEEAIARAIALIGETVRFSPVGARAAADDDPPIIAAAALTRGGAEDAGGTSESFAGRSEGSARPDEAFPPLVTTPRAPPASAAPAAPAASAGRDARDPSPSVA
jgi:hypothetical protein